MVSSLSAVVDAVAVAVAVAVAASNQALTLPPRRSSRTNLNVFVVGR